MLEVRPAEPSDGAAMCDAHVTAWRVGYRGVVPDAYLDAPAFESQRREFWSERAWLDRDEKSMLVGAIDGRVLGFAISGAERVETGMMPTGRAEVYSFYLHPDAWGTGLASELMRESEQRLRVRNFAHAVLWVLRDNPRARSFYDKAGWTWSGLDKFWYGPQQAGDPPSEPLLEVQYARVLERRAVPRMSETFSAFDG